MNTYELDISALENSAGNIAKYSQEMANHISSLRTIFNYVNQNWQNTEGNDIESINTNFNKCVSDLETRIQPTLQELSKTLYQLAADSRQNQSASM